MYVVHSLSMERAALPTGGDWFLCYDEHGFACAADGRDRMDPVCIEDLLVKRVCKRNGKLWVVVGQGSDRVIWSVTDKLTRYKQLDISVLVAPSWSKVQCSAVFLDMPRMESRFFWEAAVLYKQLGLTWWSGKHVVLQRAQTMGSLDENFGFGRWPPAERIAWQFQSRPRGF